MRRDLRNWALSPVNLAHNEEALTCSSSFQPCKLQALCHKMKYKKMLTFLAHFYAFIFRVGILQTTLDYLKLTFAFFFFNVASSVCPTALYVSAPSVTSSRTFLVKMQGIKCLATLNHLGKSSCLHTMFTWFGKQPMRM